MADTRMMRVYKPTANALRTIVNYVDPDRRKKAAEDASAAGVGIPIPFQIGTVRYTSTQHMAERGGSTEVPVFISPVDFLARRTAVFGMTRTGKSNTTKTMVSQVATTSFQTQQPIGQLIFDINGEYSNANQQDQGSAINDVFPDMTVRYRIMSTPGFRDLRTNFFNDLPIALELIGHEIEQQGRSSGGNDLKNFLSMNLDRPDQSDRSEWNHWLRRVSIFRTILLSAGYRPDPQTAAHQEIEIGKDPLADIVRKGLSSGKLDVSQFSQLGDKPSTDTLAAACRAYFGLQQQGTTSRHVSSLEEMRTFWRAVREIEMANDGHRNDASAIASKPAKDGRPGTPWLNETERSLLGVLVGKSSTTDGAIIGPSAIGAARDYHGPHGSKEIATEIYSLLAEGRIVILDLSVGNPSIREELSRKLVREIFQKSSMTFNVGGIPPKIVIYVEEAHNLIGKKAELTEIWPRIAKEGAKYGIALVYATQEPSSIHPNILANTENFFVTHLNNDSEIRTLSGFYDFADFAAGLKRSQDVGFARIKTLSASFVTPTQILKFEPSRAKQQYKDAKAAGENEWFSPLPVQGPN